MSTTADNPPALDALAARVALIVGAPQVTLSPVAGNWGLTIYRADWPDGRAAVKAGRARLPHHLQTEARMLRDLAATALPVPRLLGQTDDILLMDWIDHDSQPVRPIHERAAAEALAALHSLPQTAFGYAYATQIGALEQPNEPSSSWIEFLRDRRLMPCLRDAGDAGILDAPLATRLGRLADHLADFIAEPGGPSLLHGDVWTGNVLTRGPRLAAFVDPALFCGDPEYELAYATLHGTFGHGFFDAYGALRPIDREFRRSRRDLYLIVPLLQHAILSGPAYLHRIDRILARHGL